MKSGIVSVSFRPLSPAEVIAGARAAGLQSIEWGGDVHVPPGNLERASQVRDLTREAGLEVAAYGSYYRGPASDSDGMPFDAVLQTAKNLGARYIRVWAGVRGSSETPPEERRNLAARIREVTQQCQDQGCELVLEYHGGTLTDTLASAQQFREEVGHPALKTLWQPSVHLHEDDNLAALREILPWLAYLHVFTWSQGSDGQVIRQPLAFGESAWKNYLSLARTVEAPLAMLEFFKDNQLEQMLTDARTLNHWLTL